jgi:hypothetical protein
MNREASRRACLHTEECRSLSIETRHICADEALAPLWVAWLCRAKYCVCVCVIVPTITSNAQAHDAGLYRTNSLHTFDTAANGCPASRLEPLSCHGQGRYHGQARKPAARLHHVDTAAVVCPAPQAQPLSWHVGQQAPQTRNTQQSWCGHQHAQHGSAQLTRSTTAHLTHHSAGQSVEHGVWCLPVPCSPSP